MKWFLTNADQKLFCRCSSGEPIGYSSGQDCNGVMIYWTSGPLLDSIWRLQPCISLVPVDSYLLGFVIFLSQDFSSCFVSQSLDVSFSTIKVVCCELYNNGPDSTSVDEAEYKLSFIKKRNSLCRATASVLSIFSQTN